jgi:NAD-dependent SIR2 family protein deacetylase
VGTSAVVYPAAGLVHVAKQSGSVLVEVNLESTDISAFVDYSFTGGAGDILPVILDEYKSSISV